MRLKFLASLALVISLNATIYSNDADLVLFPVDCGEIPILNIPPPIKNTCKSSGSSFVLNDEDISLLNFPFNNQYYFHGNFNGKSPHGISIGTPKGTPICYEPGPCDRCSLNIPIPDLKKGSGCVDGIISNQKGAIIPLKFIKGENFSQFMTLYNNDVKRGFNSSRGDKILDSLIDDFSGYPLNVQEWISQHLTNVQYIEIWLIPDNSISYLVMDCQSSPGCKFAVFSNEGEDITPPLGPLSRPGEIEVVGVYKFQSDDTYTIYAKISTGEFHNDAHVFYRYENGKWKY